MKIPNKIKIGSSFLKIKFVKDIVNDGSLCGNTIMIDSNLDQATKELTLWHEIIHAINPAFTEKDVEWLSRSLYQVFEDNHLLK